MTIDQKIIWNRVGLLLASSMIGYQQDHYASARLENESPAAYQRYRSDTPTRWMLLPETSGLNGAKVATLMDHGQTLSTDMQAMKARGEALPPGSELQKLYDWWPTALISEYKVSLAGDARHPDAEELRVCVVENRGRQLA